MKKIITSICLALSSVVVADQSEKTKQIFDAQFCMDHSEVYEDSIRMMLDATGNNMAVSSVMEKFQEQFHSEEFQEVLKKAFNERFTEAEIDQIYEFVKSEAFQKYYHKLASFSKDVGMQMAQVMMAILQPPQQEEATTLPAIAVEASQVIVADESNFEELIAQNDKVIVDVYASWCGPCKALAPVLSALSEEMKGKYVFIKIDGDANRALAAKLKVRAYPSLIFYKGGKEVERKVGFIQRDQLVEVMHGCLDS